MTPPQKLGFLRPNKVLGVNKSFQGPLKMKKTDFFNNPPTKKVVTHVPGFRVVIVSPLHWPFVRNILFFLNFLQEGCVLDRPLPMLSLQKHIEIASPPEILEKKFSYPFKILFNLYMFFHSPLKLNHWGKSSLCKPTPYSQTQKV